MPPRVTLEPDDLVTPAQAGRILGVPAATVRSWIHRYEVKPLGTIGRWHVYDFGELAAIEASRHRAKSVPKAA